MSKKFLLFTLFLGTFAILPLLTLAQATYQPLVGIPGVTDNPSSSQGFTQYINALYVLAISIAGILAVLKLVIAGAKYMLTDLVSSKQEAIGDIKGALLGLLIILGAVVILLTINEDIVNTNVDVEPITNVDSGDAWRQSMLGIQNSIQSAADACTASDSCTVSRCFSCGSDPDCTYSRSAFQIRGSCFYTGGSELCESQGDIWDNRTAACISAGETRDTITIECDEDRSNPDPQTGAFTYNCSNARSECINNLNGEVLSNETASAILCAIP